MRGRCVNMPVRSVLGLVVLCALVLGSVGCRGGQSTRLTAADLTDVSAEMAAALSAAPQVRGRTPGSPAWVVAIDRVENLSSDIISRSEQWYLVEKVRGGLPLAELGRSRNISFVIAAEQLEGLRASGVLGETDAGGVRFGEDRRPTHRMSGVFRSLTRSAPGVARTDAYSVTFTITEIGSGEMVWSDDFLIKRAASGRSWN